MSDSIPHLKQGDRVRVMQTPANVLANLDNKRGKIQQVSDAFDGERYQLCVILFDDNTFASEIDSRGLMKVRS